MTEMKTLTLPDGSSFEVVDGSARDRLTDIEHQPVTTDLAYLHEGLPEGEKTVTLQGDGTFGDNAYVVSGADLLPRKTFNRSFPWNGITITKEDYTYHITGATADTASNVLFGSSASDFKIPVEHLIGKTLRLRTFANEALGTKMSAVLKFYDSSGTLIQTSVNGTLKNQASCYVANTTTSGTVACIVPEGASYMQAQLGVNSNNEVDCYVQMYVVLEDDTQAVTLDEPTAAITDTAVTTVFTFPYQSTTETKAPIAKYIDYKASNAKGDTATYLTPEAFGAVGDGYTDDINAITLCLAAAATTKQTVLMAKKYLVSAPIDISGNGLTVYINDVVYSGDDAAVKIHGQQNTVKIHSITSSGIGVKFLGDGTANSLYNDLEVNTISAASHGIIFESTTAALYQNTVRFNYIKAGGDGCYGLAYIIGDGTFITENNFYGGHISNCDWAVHSVAGNSRLMNIQVEGNVKGGFYITGYVNIINPRLGESQRDGEYPFFKFAITASASSDIYIENNVPIYINEIDISENSDVFVNAAGNENPATESRLAVLNSPIHSASLDVGVSAQSSITYTYRVYVWGKFLIMTPFMAYRKEITTETLDTRLIGQEETETEIRALSQLPTKFVVNAIDTEIYLHESYCAFGFNEFEVEQANGYTCKIYDRLENLIFDGTEHGDGVFKFNVYKDSTYCLNNSSGSLRRDFLGHYWQVIKLAAEII